MAKNRSRRGRFPILCAAILAVVTAAAVLLGCTSFPRLEVAGFRITEEEYLHTMYQARNDVLSDHAAAGLSLTDWSTETALGNPRELTMERALDRLCEHYAIAELAVERGYLTDAGYEAMVRDLEEYNRRRQEALDSGAMVTGLPQFSMADYITYRASNLRLQFCSDPENPEFQVTPEEIQQRYEADRDNLYRQPDSTEHQYVPLEEVQSIVVQSIRESRYDALIAARTEATEITGDLQSLYRFTAEQLP